MKKIMALLIAIIGIVLIGVGTISAIRLLNKPLVITENMKTKESTKNIDYQQQLIVNIEKSLQNGYIVKEGSSREKASVFLDSKQTENINFENCSGNIEFTNKNNNISYHLTTKCKKDKGNLKLDYTITSTNEYELENAKLIKVSDGYFIVGSLNINKQENNYTADSILMKFDNDHHLQFTQKILDAKETEKNTSSLINIADVYSDTHYYYVLGNVQNAVGGDLESLVEEAKKIYTESSVENPRNDFSFLFQYDKYGNLISKKVINPIQGDITVNKILTIKGSDLILASNNRIIKYNIQKQNFVYTELSMEMFQAQYMKNNSIYGYKVNCNFEHEKDKNDKIAMLNLDGKVSWSEIIENNNAIKKNTCSNYINRMYDLNKGFAVSYDNYKMLAFYDEKGKLIKRLDYSNLKKKEQTPLTITNIERRDNQIKVYIDNTNNLLIDTFNSKYKMTDRYASSLYDGINKLGNTNSINNIITTEEGFSKFIILKNNKLAIARVNYLYE